MKKILSLALMALLVVAVFVCLSPPSVMRTSMSTKSVPSASPKNAAPSIETIIYQIKDQDFETLAAFDENGRLLFDTTDNLNDEVVMNAERVNEFKERNGVLVIHNHPGGTSFSAQDFYAEAYRGTGRAIVVTYDRLYILTPGQQGWGDPGELKQAYEKYCERYTKTADTAKEWPSSSERVRWIYDQTANAVAEDYGLDYRQILIGELFCFHGIQVVTAG